VQENRTRVSAIIRLGSKLENQSLLKNAVVVYAQGLVYHPTHQKLIRLLQSAKSHQKETASPRNTEPDTGTRAVRLAEIACTRLKGERALEACERATALDPDNATVYKRLGDVLTVLGRGAEARKAYQKARELGLVSAVPESPSLVESQTLLDQLRMLDRLRKEAFIGAEEHKKRKTMLLDAAFH
jgi:Flp pilus assembly protein TadD